MSAREAKQLIEIINELVGEDIIAEEEEVRRHTDLRGDCP